MSRYCLCTWTVVSLGTELESLNNRRSVLDKLHLLPRTLLDTSFRLGPSGSLGLFVQFLVVCACDLSVVFCALDLSVVFCACDLSVLFCARDLSMVFCAYDISVVCVHMTSQCFMHVTSQWCSVHMTYEQTPLNGVYPLERHTHNVSLSPSLSLLLSLPLSLSLPPPPSTDQCMCSVITSDPCMNFDK